ARARDALLARRPSGSLEAGAPARREAARGARASRRALALGDASRALRAAALPGPFDRGAYVRRFRRLFVALFAAALCSCRVDPMGAPVRVATQGYRARVTVRHGGVEKESYEIAVRGEDRRREEEDGDALILNVNEKKAVRLAFATKTAREAPFDVAEKEIA